MNQTKFITMATAISAIALVLFSVSAAQTGNAQLPSSDELHTSADKARHTTSLLYSLTAIVTQCANEITQEQYSIVSNCMNFIDTFDKKLTEAFSETETDRNAILGTLY